MIACHCCAAVQQVDRAGFWVTQCHTPKDRLAARAEQTLLWFFHTIAHCFDQDSAKVPKRKMHFLPVEVPAIHSLPLWTFNSSIGGGPSERCKQNNQRC
jgi:hypothetical protein